MCIRDRGRNVHGEIILAKIIHAGHIHVFVISHHTAAHRCLRGKIIFVQNVPRHKQPVRAAPVAVGNREIFQKQFLFHFDKIVRFFAEFVVCVAEP